jgi:hypothetical protein
MNSANSIPENSAGNSSGYFSIYQVSHQFYLSRVEVRVVSLGDSPYGFEQLDKRSICIGYTEPEG